MSTIRRLTAGAAALGLTLSASQALACGGLFCNATAPVNQAAERIVFAQDDEGNVTQIVEVLYEGEASGFSWVLPVPGTPEPGVSSTQALDAIQARSNPNYQTVNTGNCFFGGDGDAGIDFQSSPPEIGGDPSVVVVDSGSVGPFNYETISVNVADEDPADVAVEWLEENGYDVGPMGREVLRPYLANGLNLIGFKLQSGQDAGAIRPIRLDYQASAMAIPIRPTAVAAAPDMPIMVWLLGEERAVSTNYRDVQLNEALIDWFNPGASYNNVVIAAANEAGGQGFVTEFAGATAGYSEVIYSDSMSALLEEEPIHLERYFENLNLSFGNFDGYLEVVGEHVNLREGWTPEEFVSCSWCYFRGDSPVQGMGGAAPIEGDNPITDADPIFEFDVAAFRAAVDEDVFDPLRETAALFDEFPYMTRLYTTMSADEMTVDPVFEFNPDLPDVSNVHTVDIQRNCDNDRFLATLSDGTKVVGTGFTWPYALGETDLPANTRVVQFSTSGDGEVITDNGRSIRTTLKADLPEELPAIFNMDPASNEGSGESSSDGDGGCSYSAIPGGSSSFAWLLALGCFGGVAVRRRRSHLG